MSGLPRGHTSGSGLAATGGRQRDRILEDDAHEEIAIRHGLRHLFASATTFVALCAVVSTATADESNTRIKTASAETPTDRAAGDRVRPRAEAERSEEAESETGEGESSAARADEDEADVRPGMGSTDPDELLSDFSNTREEGTDEGDETDEQSDSTDGSQTVAMPDRVDNPRPCEPYPSCTEADLGEREKLDTADFERIAANNTDAIRACYADQLSEMEAGQSEKLAIEFTVSPNGEPTDIRVDSSNLSGDEAADCVSGTVDQWYFPEPANYGHSALRITYPYSFQTE
jgi:outer membrane biosynthesis protein TonB